MLTDIHDGRVYLDGRTIVLADQVKQRLRTWLDHRNERWPDTLNPRLFVTTRTAHRPDDRVGLRWIWLTIGDVRPTAIREDRILNETLVTGGDTRHLSDLFGISFQAAMRYTAVLDHPDLIDKAHAETTTSTPNPQQKRHH